MTNGPNGLTVQLERLLAAGAVPSASPGRLVDQRPHGAAPAGVCHHAHQRREGLQLGRQLQPAAAGWLEAVGPAQRAGPTRGHHDDAIHRVPSVLQRHVCKSRQQQAEAQLERGRASPNRDAI